MGRVIAFPTARRRTDPSPPPDHCSPPYALRVSVGGIAILLPPEAWMSWQGALEFAREVINAAHDAKELEELNQ